LAGKELLNTTRLRQRPWRFDNRGSFCSVLAPTADTDTVNPQSTIGHQRDYFVLRRQFVKQPRAEVFFRGSLRSFSVNWRGLFDGRAHRCGKNPLLVALKEKSLKKNLLPAQLVNTRSAELRTERADRSTDN
jgi:hypothetical protein